MRDPNPQAAHGGAKLAAAGIGFEHGLMEAEARELNIGFVSRMTRGRPWVRMKIAADKKSAMSEISLTWYAEGGVTLHSSVITQTWENVRGKFQLVDEAIRRGDPRVFGAPAEDG